jgi:putative membrane protein
VLDAAEQTRYALPMTTGLVWLHVVGNVFWIGAITAVALLVLADADAKVRGELATTIYRRLAAPAFALSFAAGAGRLLMDTSYYFKEHHWMHGKLLFALVAIGVHHVIGARAKKLAKGEVDDAGPTKALLGVFAVAVLAAVFFVIFRIPD